MMGAFLSFGIICAFAFGIGKVLNRLGLPLITGYLFTGILCGPFMLGFLDNEAVLSLTIVDQLALSVIGLVAGSRLRVSMLKAQIRPILCTTTGLLLVGIIGISVGIVLAASSISGLGELSTLHQFLLGTVSACALLALSPPAVIAVIQEVRAEGRYTQILLSSTLLSVVVVIILFTVLLTVTKGMVSGASLGIGFVFILILNLALAGGTGLGLGWVLTQLLRTTWHDLFKAAVILVVGTSVFVFCPAFAKFSQQSFDISINIEALLVMIVAGFFITNSTQESARLDKVMSRVAPTVYLAFFTLVGLSLKLDLVQALLRLALLVFLIRGVAIFMGTFVGGWVAGEPLRVNRFAWLGYITQAGIALGLAKKIGAEFSQPFGESLSVLIVAVVVLTQIAGPILLKIAFQKIES